MRSTPPPGTSVVKREDKSERIREFIAAALASLDAAAPADAAIVLLIARSIESPAAVALANRGADLAARGIAVRAIFSSVDAEATACGWTLNSRANAYTSQIGWARDPRLLDAHEALVIGRSATWIGDSMRRDPDKRDSFEHQALDCHVTAQRTSASFERIWALSEPLRIVSAGADAASDPIHRHVDAEAGLCPVVSPPDQANGIVAGTRH